MNEWAEFLAGRLKDVPLAIKQKKRKKPLRVSQKQIRSIRNGKNIGTDRAGRS